MAKTATKDAHEIKATNLTDEERAFLDEHADQLSDSTLRAKWIHSPDEKADRPGQTLATRSRAVIEAWAEERGGTPVTVPETERDGRPGVLRMSFREGGGGNSRLEEIGWNDWFATFEQRDLVFVFQDRKRDGSQSTFFRLDSPEREDG
ncbi:MAG: hypothetical protein M3Q10_04735 [Chloroflexota bacterium]|nr:hypothetical protein [Chloroflexota bacterium]